LRDLESSYAGGTGGQSPVAIGGSKFFSLLGSKGFQSLITWQTFASPGRRPHLTRVDGLFVLSQEEDELTKRLNALKAPGT
jgi:hypothetical protein